LPRYKIEDIRTIYIANEMDTIALVQQPIASEIPKKKKKEIEAEKVAMAALAQEQATERMNVEADEEKQELAELKIEAQALDIIEEIDEPEVVVIDGTEPTLQTGLNKIESNKANEIKTDKPAAPTIKGEVKDVQAVVIVDESKKETAKVVSEPKKEPIKTKATPKPLPVKDVMSAEEKTLWVEAEKKRLAETYPDSKTVEEMDKPGKHITRVIMNIDGRVTVYLKVKHSWGATFFFIDEPGQELKSINEQYFNLKTNLKTYDGN
jgi:DNA polymerase III gamma/tau subunit